LLPVFKTANFIFVFFIFKLNFARYRKKRVSRFKGEVICPDQQQPGRLQQLDQMKEVRGGCRSGLEEDEWAGISASEKAETVGGGISGIFSADGGYSGFWVCVTGASFFSELLAAAIILQRQQGCWPPKVWVTASANEWFSRLLPNMVVQATTCKLTQGAPNHNTRKRLNPSRKQKWRKRRLTVKHLRTPKAEAAILAAVNGRILTGLLRRGQRMSISISSAVD
jgi:hypothetical protein